MGARADYRTPLEKGEGSNTGERKGREIERVLIPGTRERVFFVETPRAN